MREIVSKPLERSGQSEVVKHRRAQVGRDPSQRCHHGVNLPLQVVRCGERGRLSLPAAS